MSEFFKNKNKFLVSLSALFLAVTLGVGSFAYFSGDLAAIMASKPVTSDEDSAPDEEIEAESSSDFAEEVQDLDMTPAEFHVPDEMRGAYLVPGVDFLKTKDTSEATLCKEIDDAIASAKALTINAVIVDTVFSNQVIYQTTGAPELSSDFDILGYIVDKAREESFYIYAIFDTSHYEARQSVAVLAVGAGSASKLNSNLAEFAQRYELDGILIDGYAGGASNNSYSSYVNSGGGIGFDNFMRQSPAATVQSASKTVRRARPSTQVGLLADAVWENKSANAEGSATEAKFTSLSGGNADTKSYVEKGIVDFVAVKTYTTLDSKSEPFKEVVSWWADVAKSSGIPMYTVLNSGAETSGDQLVSQMAQADGVSRGSILNNLQNITANSQSSTKLLNYFTKGEAPAQPTPAPPAPQPKPAAPAPQPAPLPAPEKEESVEEDETPGEVDISDEDITVEEQDSDTSDTSEDTTVNESTGGSSAWSDTTETGDDWTWDVSAPGNTIHVIPAVQDLDKYPSQGRGNGSMLLSVAETASGSSIKSGSVVQITADQAITYPPKTKNCVPVATYYPLPKGAIDTVKGKAVSYKDEKNKTHRYYILESGMRVEDTDLKAVSVDSPSNNKIGDFAVSTDKNYTYVTLQTSQRITYSVKYAATGISFTFHNTTKTPGDKNISKNPLFTSASWKDNTMTLNFVKSGGFAGYKGYFNKSGNLVLRFAHTPSSIKGAKIAIDPGHGGKDQGSPGSNPKYQEKDLTRLISAYLVTELEDRGAEVYLIDSAGIEGPQRKEKAEKWGANLFVSVHCNSSSNNPKAAGTEVFYFHPFSKNMATYASKAVSGKMDTANRGAKQSYYHVTLSSQMPSVLVETGFMSNAAEYKKLVNKNYQKAIAQGIADSLESSIKAAYTGIQVSGGSENTGSTNESSSNSKNTGTVEAVWIKASISLNVGKSTTLVPTFYPEDVANDAVTWKSSNTDIVTVDANGRVSAKKEGSTKITCTTDDGGETSVCQVTVKPKESQITRVTGVEMNEKEIIVAVGGSTTLIADVSPEDADDTSVTWKSTRSSVATVSATGKVTGVKEGEATVTATTSDGNRRATCIVYVSGTSGTASSGGTTADSGVSLKDVSDAEFDYSEVEVYPGNAVRLEVISNIGEVIRGGDFTWSSEDTSIATVDSKGYVTGKKVGETYIHAKSGKYDLECYVIVSKNKVAVSGISLDETSVTVVRGKTKTVTATITPSSATNRLITWSSENTKIATISSSGVITGKSVGTTVITAKSKDGNFIAKCNVEVLRTAIKLEAIDMETTLDLYVGDKDRLVPELYPYDASETDLTWTSSNTAVCTVDAKGNLVALKRGTARIKVTSGTISATCTVTVRD